MVLDGFGSIIGLVWIISSSLLVNPFVLYWATTLVLYGTHHPLWLPFCLIGWFCLWLGFGLSSDDNLGQGCEEPIWVIWFTWQPSIPSPLMN
jgi:hypothetical protein